MIGSNQNTQVYAQQATDLNSLQDLKRLGKEDKSKAIDEIARQFESLFVQQMLTAMRKAEDALGDGGIFSSNEMKFHRDMLDQQLAVSMTSGKGIGLADSLSRQLRQQYLNTPDKLPTEAATDEVTSPVGASGIDQVLQRFARSLETSDPSEALQAQGLAASVLDQYRQAVAGYRVGQDAHPEDDSMVPPVRGTSAVLQPATDMMSPGSDMMTPLIQGLPESASPAQNTDAALDPARLQGLLPESCQAPDSRPVTVEQASAVTPVQSSIRLDHDKAATQFVVPRTPREFVEQLAPLAKSVAEELGVDYGILLAQSALESGWGRYAPGNNLFGIKSEGGWSGSNQRQTTQEYVNGGFQSQQASFRAYNNYAESFSDYADFIRNNGRYEKALAADTPEQYIRHLQQAGYATDPNYARKVMQVYRSSPMQQALADLEANNS